MAMRHDPGGTSNLMIDLWGRGGDLSGGEAGGAGGLRRWLSRPASWPTQPRSGHSSTWAGFQGSTPSICLASAGLPGVTAKIAESAEARAESCKISTTVHKLGGVRR